MTSARMMCGGLLLVSLMGCTTTGGLIARPEDGQLFGNSGPLGNGEAAIAIDPDGCQNWIIDNGAEGYASRRRDPRSGLPVCGGGAPGEVIGDHTVSSFPDFLI